MLIGKDLWGICNVTAGVITITISCISFISQPHIQPINTLSPSMSSIVDTDIVSGKANPGRTACTECARRKQKVYTQYPDPKQLNALLIINTSATAIGRATTV